MIVRIDVREEAATFCSMYAAAIDDGDGAVFAAHGMSSLGHEARELLHSELPKPTSSTPVDSRTRLLEAEAEILSFWPKLHMLNIVCDECNWRLRVVKLESLIAMQAITESLQAELLESCTAIREAEAAHWIVGRHNYDQDLCPECAGKK